MSITEIVQFLEKNGQDQTIRDIRIYTKHLIDENGEDADLVFLDTIERLKSFQKQLENFYELKFHLSYDNPDRSNNSTNPNNRESKSVLKLQTRVEPPVTEQETAETPKREYGNIDFAAEILPFAKSYIRELCRKGILPFAKPSGTYVFYRNDLEVWLQKNGQGYRDHLRKIGKQVKRSSN